MSRSKIAKRGPTISQALLAAFFILGGALHFVFPATYVSTMPPWLPRPAELVFISGVLEIVGGAGVLPRVTRRLAGLGLIVLSLAVLPANYQMLLNAHDASAAAWWQALLIFRLPLQFVLIFWIWRATRK